MSDFVDLHGVSEVTILRADGTTEIRPPYDVHELRSIVQHDSLREKARRREQALRGARAGGEARARRYAEARR